MATIILTAFVIAACVIAVTVAIAKVRLAIVASHGDYFVNCTSERALARFAHRRFAYMSERALVKIYSMASNS